MDFKQCPLLICVLLLTSADSVGTAEKKRMIIKRLPRQRSQKLQPLRQRQQPLHRLPMMEQHRTAAKPLFPAVI